MFQLILTENRKKVKTLHSYTREQDAVYRFEKIKSNEVIFQKKHVYHDKVLTEVFYEILLIKKRGDDDTDRMIRNNYGKLVNEKVDDDEWVIIDKIDYPVEEQFSVTGANRKLSAKEIIDNIVKLKTKGNEQKQVLMINNKLVIEGSSLYMVTCKTIEENIRLYNFIRMYCHEKKIGGILFFGSINKPDRKVWYKKIHEITGVGYNRLYRKTSR